MQNMLFFNKNRAHDMELRVIMGSEKAAGEHKLDLDSLKFYFPLEHELNLTFGGSQVLNSG